MPQSQTNSYSSVAKRIFEWTNNGIATAVILLVALVGGRQLISLWQTGDADLSRSAAPIMAWPTFESCAIEFSNQPYQLKRLHLRMSSEALLAELIRQCEIVLEESPQPANSPTTSESSMLTGLREVLPQKSRPGHWRIFCGEDAAPIANTATPNPGDSTQFNSGTPRLPLAIGIRDNCSGDYPSRMVVWAIATQDATNDSGSYSTKDRVNDRESGWTIFVCQSTIESSQSGESRNSVPLPPASRRTLAVTDPAGGQLIGFSGGDLPTARQFFSNYAIKHRWRVDPDWQNVGESWQVCFHTDALHNLQNSPNLPNVQPNQARRVRVHITRGAENRLLGLIIIEPISAQPIRSETTP